MIIQMVMAMADTSLKSLIAPSFYIVHDDLRSGRHTHYWLRGGRGSTKSSFVSIEVILGIMKNPNTNAVALRKVGATIKDSIYSQLLWAIDKLGVADRWTAKLSPLELIYNETGQRILFRGADDPQKIKSTKVAQGYIRYIWYEELAEFGGMEEIRSINQSLMRGGEKFDVFYSYNPPVSVQSWVNREALIQRNDRLVHSSTYLDVPVKWLGEQFFAEAETLKNIDATAYEHEYLGIAVGTGAEIFTNWDVSDDVPQNAEYYDDVKYGQDFGFNHATALLALGIKNDDVYIFREIYETEKDSAEIVQIADEQGWDKRTIMYCDCAEPDRIATWRRGGYLAVGCDKTCGVLGQIDWLKRRKIHIHSSCKNTIDEISKWEWQLDKSTQEYIDKPVPFHDDAMAALRYGIEMWRLRGNMPPKKKPKKENEGDRIKRELFKNPRRRRYL